MANFDPNYRDATTGQIGRYVIPSMKTLQYMQYTDWNPPSGIGYVLAGNSGEGLAAAWFDRTGLTLGRVRDLPIA